MPSKTKKTGRTSRQDCSWVDIDEAGTGLSVDDFITTMVVLTANALRRTVTAPYVEQADVTAAEWRMLSVIAEAKTLPFPELVRRSATDKSLVSRSLRLLETRGLVVLHAVDGAPRKGLTCELSAEGWKFYRKVMPVARRAQANMIRVLGNEERRVLHRALHKLRRACADESATPDDE